MVTNLSNQHDLLIAIVNNGYGKKVIKKGKKIGISGFTIFLGKGMTRKKTISRFLDLDEARREVVLMVVKREHALDYMNTFNEKFNFNKPHHGIIFTIPIMQVLGSCLFSQDKSDKGVDSLMYNLIFTIVERGKAETVIKAAQTAGSKGATIINARGSGIHESEKLFNMEISPEKEIVLIIANKDNTENITSAIRDDMGIDQPGKGIIFVQNINEAIGLFKEIDTD